MSSPERSHIGWFFINEVDQKNVDPRCNIHSCYVTHTFSDVTDVVKIAARDCRDLDTSELGIFDEAGRESRDKLLCMYFVPFLSIGPLVFHHVGCSLKFHVGLGSDVLQGLCWLWLTAVAIIMGPQNKIDHPSRRYRQLMQVPVLSVRGM